MGKGEKMNEKIKKFWSWIKKFGGWIVAGILGIITFMRIKPSTRARGDIDKLRSDNDELVRQLERSAGEVGALGGISRLDESSIRQLRAHLDDARRINQEAGESSTANDSTINELAENNRRLRAWLETYGSQLENLEERSEH